MADVQLEHGHTRIADALIEALSRAPMPGQHHRVMWAMIRLLYGWRKKSDRIAASQIAMATGMEERATRRVLADLVSWHLLTRTAGGAGRAARWSIQKDFDRWTIGETSRAEYLRGYKPRAQRPGRRDPGQETTPGAETRVSSAQTQGAENPATQGAETPHQRERENYQRELLPSGGACGPAIPAGRSPWLNLLQGEPPNGYETAEDWLTEHLPIVEGEADKQLGGNADATQRNGAIKALLCRYWRNKTGPPKRASPHAPTRMERIAEAVRKSEERELERQRRHNQTTDASYPVRALPEG